MPVKYYQFNWEIVLSLPLLDQLRCVLGICKYIQTPNSIWIWMHRKNKWTNPLLWNVLINTFVPISFKGDFKFSNIGITYVRSFVRSCALLSFISTEFKCNSDFLFYKLKSLILIKRFVFCECELCHPLWMGNKPWMCIIIYIRF